MFCGLQVVLLREDHTNFGSRESVYHRIGPLIPKHNEQARFAQVCTMDTNDQLCAWHGPAFAQSLREPMLIGLGNMLKEHNANAKVFRKLLRCTTQM